MPITRGHFIDMYKFFKLIFPIITGVFLVVISGCESQNHTNQAKTGQVQAKPLGSLRIPLSGPVGVIDPGLVYETNQVEFVEQLFLGLTDFKPDKDTGSYQVVPEWATNWQANEDNTIYTFHLRQDVKWTDGQKMTAHDLVWTIQRNLSKEMDSPNASTLYILNNAEAFHQDNSVDVSSLGVRAIDDYTVEFRLTHAAAYFPAMVSLRAYRPVPRHIIQEYGNNWTDPENIQTNASYMLTKWDKGNQIVLTKNPNYYEAEKVNISEVRYHIVPESSIGLTMYENNDLDLIGGQVYLRLPQMEIPRIQADPILSNEIKRGPLACTEWYGLNTQRAPMDNLLVRKAIAAAIDKQLLIDIVIKGNHIPAMTFTHPLSFGSVNQKEQKIGIAFDPEQAKQWLEQAGYPEGQEFPELVLMHPSGETHRGIANGIKTLLKHYLNINLKVTALDWNHYLDQIIPLQPSSPHLFRVSWCSDYPDANDWLHAVFHRDSPFNWLTGINLEPFVQAVDKAQRISEPNQRKKLYHHAEQILTEQEVAIVPIYFSNTQFLVKPWVKGWFNMAFGGQHIRDWSLEYK